MKKIAHLTSYRPRISRRFKREFLSPRAREEQCLPAGQLMNESDEAAPRRGRAWTRFPDLGARSNIHLLRARAGLKRAIPVERRLRDEIATGVETQNHDPAKPIRRNQSMRRRKKAW
jgi:hypothetical protein